MTFKQKALQGRLITQGYHASQQVLCISMKWICVDVRSRLPMRECQFSQCVEAMSMQAVKPCHNLGPTSDARCAKALRCPLWTSWLEHCFSQNCGRTHTVPPETHAHLGQQLNHVKQREVSNLGFRFTSSCNLA